jgi:hypothetical protein
MRSFSAVRAGVAATALALVPALVPAVAEAAPAHSGVVGTRSSAVFPQLVAATPAPHVDALAVGGGTTYAGGLFDTMTQGGAARSGLGNLTAFSSTNGTFVNGFEASTNGLVNDLELDVANNALYVAGNFTSVNGVTRSGLAKVDATSGELITTFRAPAGKIYDVDLVTVNGVTHLFAGGPGKGLISLNPNSGARDGYSFPAITDKIPGSWGAGIAVYGFAVHGDKLAAVGDFRTVGNQPRSRFVMLNLGAGGAAVDDWYYQPFSKPCASTASRRVAYLQGVDFSPTGSHVSVAATGQIPANASEVWHYWNTPAQKSETTVCDAVGRFSTADDSAPQWINYTGGDSVWRVQDTGAAVYTSGHFQWFDNPDGFASQGTGDRGGLGQPGYPAARRLGIAALDTGNNGRALDWNPGATGFKQGGKALLATPPGSPGAGLWIGNDSKRFGGQPRYGLAFAPL